MSVVKDSKDVAPAIGLDAAVGAEGCVARSVALGRAATIPGACSAKDDRGQDCTVGG
jgi:hypothetical protein